MKKRVRNRTKLRLRLLSLTIILLIGVIITSVYKDLRQVLKNKSEIAVLSNKYNNLLHEEESLQSEITKLQDSNYVARYAREKWLLTLPDEIIIKQANKEEWKTLFFMKLFLYNTK